MNGPAAIATLVSPVSVPIALPRSFCENTALTIESEPGVTSAPATPCSVRKTTSCVPVWARPHAADVTREHRDAGDEDAPAAEQVAERTADEHERAERRAGRRR